MSGKTSSSLHTRRRFLNRAGLLAVSAPFMAASAQAAALPFADIVDCHIHLWARDKKRFPYQPNPRYSPDYASTADQ